MTRFIAVASGKGGAGKTTTAVNLAAALSSYGANVIILDGSLATPNVRYHLGFGSKLNSLQDVLLGKVGIDRAIYLHPTGLRAVIAEPSMESIHLKSIDSAAAALIGKSEIVIIDSAPGLGSAARSALECSDETIIVANPDAASLSDAARTISMAEHLGSNVIGVVLNKVSGKNHEIPLRRIESGLKKPVIGVIADDKNVPVSISLKQPVVCTHPESHAAIEFRNLAKMILR